VGNSANAQAMLGGRRYVDAGNDRSKRLTARAGCMHLSAPTARAARRRLTSALLMDAPGTASRQRRARGALTWQRETVDAPAERGTLGGTHRGRQGHGDGAGKEKTSSPSVTSSRTRSPGKAAWFTAVPLCRSARRPATPAAYRPPRPLQADRKAARSSGQWRASCGRRASTGRAQTLSGWIQR
jgi:hypothetical protein